MSTTLRMIIACRAADAPALNAWWRANVDPEGGDTFDVPLQLPTDPPGTVRGYWAGVTLTPAQVIVVVQKLCQIAAISFPADWSTSTLSQKKAWFLANKADLLTTGKVRIRFCGVDDQWDDPELLLAEAGYQRAVL